MTILGVPDLQRLKKGLRRIEYGGYGCWKTEILDLLHCSSDWLCDQITKNHSPLRRKVCPCFTMSSEGIIHRVKRMIETEETS